MSKEEFVEQQHRRVPIEIYERLKMERDTAIEYYQLGRAALERYKLDEAEKWYRKALEIYEHIGDPPLMVNTFAGFGLLRWQQNKRDEAVSWFGKAWAIATEYQMQISQQIQIYLARTMKAMGEKELTKAWRKAFKDKEAPLTDLHKTLEKLEGKD